MDDVQTDLLDTVEAAALLDVKRGTLEAWRLNKRYELPYVRVGRNVRYRRRDLLEFLNKRTVAA
jgi:excisionase family DNA binding protein